MAEINSDGGHDRQRKGSQRSKKLSTKVDLTPMVDLGFLLITFFMLTASWSKPRAFELNLPAGEKPDQPIGRNASLTLIPVAGEKVFYFHGILQEAIDTNEYGVTGFAISNGIGDVIREKQRQMDKYFKGGRKEMMLIIKPSSGSYYKSIVDVLD